VGDEGHLLFHSVIPAKAGIQLVKNFGVADDMGFVRYAGWLISAGFQLSLE
jgi:hypothetical protein